MQNILRTAVSTVRSLQEQVDTIYEAALEAKNSDWDSGEKFASREELSEKINRSRQYGDEKGAKREGEVRIREKPREGGKERVRSDSKSYSELLGSGDNTKASTKEERFLVNKVAKTSSSVNSSEGSRQVSRSQPSSAQGESNGRRISIVNGADPLGLLKGESSSASSHNPVQSLLPEEVPSKQSDGLSSHVTERDYEMRVSPILEKERKSLDIPPVMDSERVQCSVQSKHAQTRFSSDSHNSSAKEVRQISTSYTRGSQKKKDSFPMEGEDFTLSEGRSSIEGGISSKEEYSSSIEKKFLPSNECFSTKEKESLLLPTGNFLVIRGTEADSTEGLFVLEEIPVYPPAEESVNADKPKVPNTQNVIIEEKINAQDDSHVSIPLSSHNMKPPSTTYPPIMQPVSEQSSPLTTSSLNPTPLIISPLMLSPPFSPPDSPSLRPSFHPPPPTLNSSILPPKPPASTTSHSPTIPPPPLSSPPAQPSPPNVPPPDIPPPNVPPANIPPPNVLPHNAPLPNVPPPNVPPPNLPPHAPEEDLLKDRAHQLEKELEDAAHSLGVGESQLESKSAQLTEALGENSYFSQNPEKRERKSSRREGSYGNSNGEELDKNTKTLIEQLQNTNIELLNEGHNLAKRVGNLEESLKRKKFEQRKLEQTVKELQNEEFMLKRALEKKGDEIEESNNVIIQNKADKKKIEKMQAELEKERNKVADLQDEVKEKEAEILSEGRRGKEKIDDLNRIIINKDLDLEGLREKLVQAEKSKQMMLHGKEEELEAVREKLGRLEAKECQDLLPMMNRIGELEILLKAETSDKMSIELELNNLKSDTNKEQKQFQEIRTVLEQQVKQSEEMLQEKSEEFEKNINILRKKFFRKETENSRLKAESDLTRISHEREIGRLKKDIAAAVGGEKQRNKILQKECRDLEEQLEIAQASLGELKAEIGRASSREDINGGKKEGGLGKIPARRILSAENGVYGGELHRVENDEGENEGKIYDRQEDEAQDYYRENRATNGSLDRTQIIVSNNISSDMEYVSNMISQTEQNSKISRLKADLRSCKNERDLYAQITAELGDENLRLSNRLLEAEEELKEMVGEKRNWSGLEGELKKCKHNLEKEKQKADLFQQQCQAFAQKMPYPKSSQ